MNQQFTKTTRLLINTLWGLLLISSIPNTLEAQPTIEEKNALSITARAFNQSIKLRWAPTSMTAWKACNEGGYVLERYTIRRGKEVLTLAERSKPKVLTPKPLKPWTTQEQWKPLMEKNEYAAIAAQALYGKSFNLTQGGKSLQDLKDDSQNRHSFGLFAADQSVEVAQALGLYFDDKTVVKGEYYLYKVYPAKGIANIQVDTGYIYLGTDEVYDLPKPTEVSTNFSDKVVYISWEKEISSKFYSSFIVERSEGGKAFEVINALPFVGMDTKASQKNKMVMMDSLNANDLDYTYRVKGKTIFGEVGPASLPSSGQGINAKVAPPHIESVLNQNNLGLGVAWVFEKNNESEIIGFQLSRSDNDQGPFEVISGATTIDKTLRYIIDEAPLPVNYYKIVAIDKYGRRVSSFAALAQLDDTTPPAAPVNLRGTIMEDGEMLVTWSSNTEADVMGYRVYMANRKDRKEYVQITSKPIRQNFYSHIVPMNTLSEEVFFKVRAVDYRQNKSDFSEIQTVTRPDSIPPAAPVFLSARASQKAVDLVWENSASSDVVRMVLERKSNKEKDWTSIKELAFPDDMDFKSYQDTTAKRGQLYAYRLKAIDDADLITFSRIIKASKIDNGIRRPVEKINAAINRRKKMVALQWDYQPDGNDLTHFVIYRAAEDERPRKYDSIKKVKALNNAQSWVYEDKSLQMDTSYKYQIRAVYKNGAQSPLSELVSVVY